MVESAKLRPGEVVISLRHDPDRDINGHNGAMVCSLSVSDEGDADSLALALDEAVTLLAYHELGLSNAEWDTEVEFYKASVLERLFPEEYAEAEAGLDQKVEVTQDGNVYTLSFDSETEGSA